jgi:hypothetical protein
MRASICLRLLVFCCLWSITTPALAKEGEIRLDDVIVPSLEQAMKLAKKGSTITLGAGSFAQAGILSADDVKIIGVAGKTQIHSKTVQGKGALLILGENTLIKNIECFDIKVRDQNGACVRFEGHNLELNNVYFHDSEQGLLTGPKPGRILIINSKFERLGNNTGQSHGIYVGGGELYIFKSKFLSSKNEGMEIKSRAKKTVIDRSVIASLDGMDSRLLDIPNGGELIVRDSILQQGDESSNWDLIGFGLEGYFDAKHRIELVGNIIIMEKQIANQMLHIKEGIVPLLVKDNLIIGRFIDQSHSDNLYFSNREDAGIVAAPLLPETH